jgi:hypothetical protein
MCVCVRGECVLCAVRGVSGDCAVSVCIVRVRRGCIVSCVGSEACVVCAV